MRHAYMIMAHNQFELLELLVKCLDWPQNDIYIHVDAKVKAFDLERFEGLTKHSPVYFTERFDIGWGGDGMIFCELAMLKQAVRGGYDYYHLLSGVDLPLRSAAQIQAFFEENRGYEFLHFCGPGFCREQSVIDRVRYWYPLQNRLGRGHGLLRYAAGGVHRVQKLLGVDRLRKASFELKCGSQWFSITHDLAQYVLSEEAWIVRHFCKGLAADELFLQTLVWNSDYKNRLYRPNDNGDYHSCMRFVDWTRGDPYVFRDGDYDELIGSDYLFARKFDIRSDRTVCERVAEHALADAERAG